MDKDAEIAERFRERYSLPVSDAALAVEREAIGANVGANGYTTLRQAEMLAEKLRLTRGTFLLDVGSGRGWPGLYLARSTGCSVVLSDIPEPALRVALGRIERKGPARRAAIVRASGTQLPFGTRSFDAISHTDTL
jgi:ubiquinone/menaquinone biosynthesis C-methylase UbiE